MKSVFNEEYSHQLVNESIKNIISSPKTLLASALMLGLIDVGYVLPKLNEIQSKVEQSLQQKTPEQVQQIETKATQQQNSPKIENLYVKIKDSWKNYKPMTPSAARQLLPASNEQLSKEFYEKAKQMIKHDEGKRARLYKDTKGKWTIGYGHLIASKDELNKYKNKSLTDKEIDSLLDIDINSKIKTATKLFPKFKEYNDDFKITLLNGIFRGDISGSPKTVELINQGLFKQAAKEYLNNRDYRNASKPNATDRGVAIRMYRNAQNIAKQIIK